jgi:ABC-type lipoprotein export system ATPase subunit
VTLLQLKNICKRYERPDHSVEALVGVSLEIGEGEFVVIRGPSGCGKTTLLLTAGGLLAPDSGTVTICGRQPYALGADDRAALRATTIGFVFQQFHLVPYLSVLENVLSPTLATEIPDAANRAHELVSRFGLSERSTHLPGELSTGERQRTALARAMLTKPRLILADEPTGNLDEANARGVMDGLSAFAVEGGAVLLVTHDASPTSAGRILHMVNGCLASPDAAA